MARQYADEQAGWALAKRGKEAKAVKITETGDGVPLGTERTLGCTYLPLTASKQQFRTWVAQFQRVNQGGNLSLSAVLAWNLKRLEEEGHTTRQRATSYKRLNGFFGPEFGVKGLNVQRCKDYATQAEADGYARATIFLELGLLRSVMRKAYQYDVINTPIHEKLWNISKPVGRQETLTPEQFWAWYRECASQHLRLFLVVALLTAQRKTAVCELKWEHVDFENGVIDFEAGLRKKRGINDKGYQKSRAVVRMTDTLRAHLMAAKTVAQSAYVIEYQGKRIEGESGVQKGVKMAARAAGLPDWVTPHVLRHTAATWAQEAGLDANKIVSMTGHKDERTLKSVYLHGNKTGAGSQEAVEAVEKRMGGKLRVVK